jgi:hypothetical protein
LKPDQGLKAQLKASGAKGFDMAIGQATGFKRGMHVTVNPSRCGCVLLLLLLLLLLLMTTTITFQLVTPLQPKWLRRAAARVGGEADEQRHSAHGGVRAPAGSDCDIGLCQ